MSRRARDERSTPGRPTRFTRVVAALLLPLFLGAYLLDVVHYATVQHAPCPVDGALAHVGDGHGHDGHGHEHASAPDLEEGAGETRRVEPAPEPHDEHDHCSLLLLSNKATPDPDAPGVEVRAPEPTGAVVLATTAAAGPRIPAFLLAPKNSPPRAS